MGIGQEVTKGERWSLLAAIVSNAGQLALLLVFVRLIPKEAFAVMAVANAVVGLPQLMLQTGLSHSLFSQEGQEQEQLSTLFWLHLACAFVITAVIIPAALPLSFFYGGQYLREVIWLSGITLIFKAVAALYRVLHLKKLNYYFLARVDITTFFAGGIISLFLAFQGFGVFALISQVMVRSAVECLLLFLEGRFLFFPSLQFNLASIRKHLHFAIGHIGERLSMWATTQVDVLLIGKLLGMELLGVYEIFRRLLNRPPAALGEMMERIALPLMARYRYRREVLKRVYLNNIKIMASIVFPAYTWFAVSASVILAFLFGEGWIVHSGVFACMALSVAFNSLGHPLDNFLVATGHIRRLFLWNLAYMPLMIVGLLWGVQGGLLGVAALMLALALFVNNPAFYFLLRSVVLVQANIYFQPIAFSIFLVLISIFLPAAFLWIFPWTGGAWVLGTIIFALVYLLLMRQFQPIIWDRIIAGLF